jgi:23S rRNA (guanosine2251-2'-O)-methyltransferase
MTIYGKNPAMEVLKSKKRVTKAYVTKTTLELIKPYSKQIGEVQVIDAVKMSKQFGDKTQGIVLEIAEYKYADLNKVLKRVEEKENVTLVILDSLEDPHNLGAILRSADATGVDGIIIPKNRSVRLNDTVAKVSTGAIEHVDVCEVTNLNMTINDLKDKGFWVIGLELDGTIDYREQDYKGKIAVVVGSEGRGISKLVKENCDFLVRIPMYGKVNSLNASVSAGLLLYQILTSRGL